jgi:sortase (surface protein transpeptidase)
MPPPCAAVFWDLAKLNLEDEIDVTVEGVTFRYSVTSNEAVGEDASWASIFATTVDESITVVTCGGDFNPQTRNYDKRQVVTAVRIEP